MQDVSERAAAFGVPSSAWPSIPVAEWQTTGYRDRVQLERPR
jgi:hypothetical protein